MLAAGQRLRRAEEFSAAVRSGGRGSRGGLVVHLLARPELQSGRDSGPAAPPTAAARAGFVVPRAVGPAVTRNKVRRRLRHLLRERLSTLPAGTDVVVRVLPPAAGSSFQRLGVDLDAALAAARRKGRTR